MRTSTAAAIMVISLGTCLAVCSAAPAPDAKYKLVDNGLTAWHIVITRAASPAEVHAARELQSFILQMSGVQIPMVCFDMYNNECPMYDHEILLGWSWGGVGNNPRMARVLADSNVLLKKIDFNKLGQEGFVIRTAGGHLVIAGGRPRGTLYGVYSFLEKYLGCRWFDSGVSVIPTRTTMSLDEIDDTQVPVMRLRDIAIGNFHGDPDLAARNKVNGAPLTDMYGGHFGWADPMCHTLGSLLPDGKYFKEHPEYYALVNGTRKTSQPCLTNPDVLNIVTENVRKWMKDKPDMEVFDVSQNDNDGHCQCPACKALDDREESPQGSLLTFINNVAGAVAKDFPGKYVCTFAYAYSEKPPKTIKPAANVLIRLCSFYNAPMWDHDQRNKQWSGLFADNVIAWSAKTQNLFIWDYCMELSHHMMPVPNFNLIGPDMHGFATHGVRGYFAQGASTGPGLPTQQLRAYLLAKLAWDPNYDVDTGMNEYLAAYYGKAAGTIRQYLDLMRQNAPTDPADQQAKPYDKPFQNNWTHLSPTRWWLKPELLKQYDALFDKAEDLVKDNPIRQMRVKITRLELQYVQIRTLPRDDPQRARIIATFFDVIKYTPIQDIGYGICKSSNVYRHATPADFKKYLDEGGQ